MVKKWEKSQTSLVMGILNITPDSFSDGGAYMDVQEAVLHAEKMVRDGASIIDVGGVSTRPGHSEVSIHEETNRVIPVIKALRKALPNTYLSIDTWRSEVAEAAVLAGADLLNDQWGAKKDSKMAAIAAKYDIPICLMHNRMDRDYENFMEEVKADLEESVAICRRAGVKDEHIILDPGFGFAKSVEQNLEVLRRIDEIVALGFEVLLGTSRKSTIGQVLNLETNDRIEGTGATVVYGLAKGCRIVRVHDVLEIARMVRMTDAIMGHIALKNEKG